MDPKLLELRKDLEDSIEEVRASACVVRHGVWLKYQVFSCAGRGDARAVSAANRRKPELDSLVLEGWTIFDELTRALG
jgi:hypothetical protein